MSKILYINRAGIPENAPGIRIYNLAKNLRDLGHEVLFYCDKPDYEKDMRINYDGFSYYYATNYKNSKFSFFSNLYELVCAPKSFNKIKVLITEYKPDTIILYNDIFALTSKLIKYCEDTDIRLIADVTEWYGRRKSNKVTDKIVPFLTNLRIEKLDKKVGNIIAITPYLENFYKKKGCKTIFLPPVFDVEDINVNKFNYYPNFVLNLVYAGVPGNKDIINPILDAIKTINSKEIKIRIDLVGIDEKYLTDSWEKTSFKINGIFAHGRLSHKQTIEIVKRADFGVLLRREERYAKAGFSTKFSECMSNGVAMICNSVGGADLFVSNLEDGVIIESVTENLLVKRLTSILEMDSKEIIGVRKKAYSKSKKIFERKAYIEKMKLFFNDLK